MIFLYFILAIIAYLALPEWRKANIIEIKSSHKCPPPSEAAQALFKPGAAEHGNRRGTK